MALTMTFSVRDAGPLRQVVLELTGELDGLHARRLQQRLATLPDGDVVIIDLRGLEFIDSTGLGLLVAAKRTHGDRLRLVGASPPVRHVFEHSGTLELLDETQM